MSLSSQFLDFSFGYLNEQWASVYILLCYRTTQCSGDRLSQSCFCRSPSDLICFLFPSLISIEMEKCTICSLSLFIKLWNRSCVRSTRG
ncbi:hypothetical protein FKM82_003631 [Ascaphus truei]